ncbi:hypothetical protein [Pseudoroseomonas cervicalis]|uniref:hypothetical protein n=1 Tax=Teichococcus cervicalis TaxID=204525 RepID=UPI0027807CDD|nr:hypothetical protein [Pseudoroseomonas cervicalis]MDQ1079712.1 hypothetical protein [Pseudoroseomonas cervicalis]
MQGMNATSQVYIETHFLTVIRARIGAALRATWGGRGAAKRIARVADATPRAASAWLYAQAAPRSPEIIALMAASDEFEREVLDLVHELRLRMEQTPQCRPIAPSTSAAGAAAMSPPTQSRSAAAS